MNGKNSDLTRRAWQAIARTPTGGRLASHAWLDGISAFFCVYLIKREKVLSMRIIK